MRSKLTQHEPFKRVVLYARQYRSNQDINNTLKQVIAYLQRVKMDVYLDIDTAEHVHLSLPVLPREQMNPVHDVIVVIGGDGSLLSAARMAIHVDVPVIGINRGRLGFLTDISPQHIDEQLGPVLNGHYLTEKRFLLHMQHPTKPHITGSALNDMVLSRAKSTHLIAFDVYINQQFVSHYRADGLIVATPTGSTAYALSAGGPIMHPELHALVIVPMFSHSLSARPLVVDAHASLVLQISEDNESELQISCDGHESHPIQPGQSILLQKHARQLRLLHPCDYHYYDTLRLKLGWGSKPKE